MSENIIAIQKPNRKSKIIVYIDPVDMANVQNQVDNFSNILLSK